LQQVGSNVVATGNGAIDLTGLSGPTTNPQGPEGYISPSVTFITTGAGGVLADVYAAATFSGPTSFGTGFFMFASSGSGDYVGINGPGNLFHLVLVPMGYVSGNALSDSSTYNGATFTTLGITPGTYTWTWGTGANQNFTLDAIATGVPDSGSTFGLFLLSFAALFGASRFRSQQSA
jgi:hypothetical protein